jgi:hypothetical protein
VRNRTDLPGTLTGLAARANVGGSTREPACRIIHLDAPARDIE